MEAERKRFTVFAVGYIHKVAIDPDSKIRATKKTRKTHMQQIKIKRC